jgi:hypothetical protein
MLNQNLDWDPARAANFVDWNPPAPAIDPKTPEARQAIQNSYSAWMTSNAQARTAFLGSGLRAKLFACLTSSQSTTNPLFHYAKFATRSFLDAEEV